MPSMILSISWSAAVGAIGGNSRNVIAELQDDVAAASGVDRPAGRRGSAGAARRERQGEG